MQEIIFIVVLAFTIACATVEELHSMTQPKVEIIENTKTLLV